jgi:site-specific DNA-cytosine methylase
MARDYKDGRDLIQEDVNMESTNKKYVLRRLTPTECARLQGFPDWWCDGANGSDSSQYKLWGNGVALPCVCDVLGRIAEFERNQNLHDTL